MTITPRQRRLKKRLQALPTAKHVCEHFGVWVRKPKVTGNLVCVVCGKP